MPLCVHGCILFASSDYLSFCSSWPSSSCCPSSLSSSWSSSVSSSFSCSCTFSSFPPFLLPQPRILVIVFLVLISSSSSCPSHFVSSLSASTSVHFCCSPTSSDSAFPSRHPSQEAGVILCCLRLRSPLRHRTLVNSRLA